MTSCVAIPNMTDNVEYTTDPFYEDKLKQEESIRFTPKPMTNEQLKESFLSLNLPLSDTDHIFKQCKKIRTKYLNGVLCDIGDVSIEYVKDNNHVLLRKIKCVIYNQAVILRSGNELNNLVIPRFQIITIKDDKIISISYDDLYIEYDTDVMFFIVWENLSYDDDIKVQKKLYHSPENSESISEFALFICETGYSGINYTTTPILPNGKIALLYTETPCNPTLGLALEDYRYDYLGLINMVSIRDIGKILSIVRGYKLKPCFRDIGTLGSYITVEQVASKKLSADKSEINTFYLNNNIKTGFEPITMDGVSFSEFKGKSFNHLLASKQYTTIEFQRESLEKGDYNNTYIEKQLKNYNDLLKYAKEKDEAALVEYRDLEDIITRLFVIIVDNINREIAKNTGNMFIKDRRCVNIEMPRFTLMYLRDSIDIQRVEGPEAIGGSVYRDPPTYANYILERLVQQTKIVSGSFYHGITYRIQA